MWKNENPRKPSCLETKLQAKKLEADTVVVFLASVWRIQKPFLEQRVPHLTRRYGTVRPQFYDQIEVWRICHKIRIQHKILDLKFYVISSLFGNAVASCCGRLRRGRIENLLHFALGERKGRITITAPTLSPAPFLRR